MPLRDHFRPPLENWASWDSLHGFWPSMIVLALSRRLPERYVAAPHVHPGSGIEIDVATFDVDPPLMGPSRKDECGGVAVAVWAPPEPTLAVVAESLDPDEYEVRVYDARHGRRLVAAVEIVSPANKDRPEHRQAFLAKCSALLQARVSVTIIDLVTTRTANLYAELLDSLGLVDPAFADDPPPLYAAACRSLAKDGQRAFQAWAHPLTLGQPLPTLPLWLAEDLAVPLELEPSYEEACQVLRIR